MAKTFLTGLLTVLFFLSGCGGRNSDQVWEDSKTAGRHVNRGIRSLGGKHGSSRSVQNREDFMPASAAYTAGNTQDWGFTPLTDYQTNDELAMADYLSTQPTMSPGDPGSTIPSIQSFREASSDPRLAASFKMIHFDYNSDLIKGSDNLAILQSAANYLRNHPNTYIFVAGHTDERGPQAFNLALGARRANTVRNELLALGVHYDNVYTISYGTEKPLNFAHDEEAWAQNRRVEFLIYEK